MNESASPASDATLHFYTTNGRLMLWFVLGFAMIGTGLWRLLTYQDSAYGVAMGALFIGFALRLRFRPVVTLNEHSVELRPSLLGKLRHAKYLEVAALTVRQSSAEIETDVGGTINRLPLPLHLLTKDDSARLIDDLGRRCHAHRTAAAKQAAAQPAD